MGSDVKYKLIDLQTGEVVSAGLSIDELRWMLNDIFWQEDELDFSDAYYNEIYYTLLNCDYEVIIDEEC